MLVLNNKKGGAIMEEIKNEQLDNVSGGVLVRFGEEPPKKVKCFFYCKKCGKSWTEEVVDPERYNYCKYCEWWGCLRKIIKKR